jgi:hypothetical protein
MIARATASRSAETFGDVRLALDVTGTIGYLRACPCVAVPVDPMSFPDRNPFSRPACAQPGAAR